MVPDPTNGVISGYNINCTTSSGLMLEPLSIGPAEVMAMITNLTAFTEYTCTIFADTGAGEGSLSEPITAVTAEGGKYTHKSGRGLGP